MPDFSRSFFFFFKEGEGLFAFLEKYINQSGNMTIYQLRDEAEKLRVDLNSSSL